MKSLLPKFVLLLNIALCVLCIVQWVRETRLHGEISTLAHSDRAKANDLLKLESTVKKWEAEISRLDARVQELTANEQTNNVQRAALTRELRQAENNKLALDRQLTSYKEAVDRQNENIKAQNEAIAKQNETIKDQNENLKTLGGERNELVTKLNERTQLYNELVEKFNGLVAQVEQSQASAKKN